MRYLIILLVILFATSCIRPPVYPIYTYAEQTIVPDSLREAQAKFIKDIVSAAGQNFSTSDYEDPEDVIKQAERTSDKLFVRKIYGLNIKVSNNSSYFISYEELNDSLKVIYLKLKYN